MQSHSPTTNWNPQIAIGVVAVGLLAAVWLNMAKLQMGLGQPQHDISDVPIARNITSDEIEQLRNGKPLALILAEQADYSPLARAVETRKDQADGRTLLAPQPANETTTAFKNGSLKLGDSSAEQNSPPAALPPDTQPAMQPPPQEKSGFRLPFQDLAVEPATFEDSTSAPVGSPHPTPDDSEPDELTFPAAIPPQAVPRSNPVGGTAGPTGGSFLEKFPGQSQHLPNVKHGPALNSALPPATAEPTLALPSANQLPNAADLSPPPFGDWASPASNNSETEQVRASSRPTPAVQTAATKPSHAEPSAAPSHSSTQTQTGFPPIPTTAPSPRVAGRVDEPGFPVLTAEAGDTWWSLAQRAYDDGRYFRDLYAFNREHIPEYSQIPTGARIVCPPVELFTRAATPVPSTPPQTPAVEKQRQYSTREGDTLFGIAREQLGQASRFAELQQLNRSRLPRNFGHLTPLPAGTELLLPAR